ncbi:hypothetical protein DdX_21380 [Ditylenchus destructor]|uniref:F-box domain-containing protein n=1 Tax=Ditylenchus destructor TaxID=166010 RepID=A0AAD4QRE7_9BILA|nr:hypothetical protein DdX_21380 [Ditylenchus destructor]
MSCSKPLPPFTFDLLCYLNRNQLERFSIVCRPLKNFIDRYFHAKPYRVFDGLNIRGGSYRLKHKYVQWHPNRDDYSAQQFLAGQKCSIDESKHPRDDFAYYSFAEMRPYLGPTVRIKETWIYVAGDSTYNPEHIAEMESIEYLWRDANVYIRHTTYYTIRICANDFLPILNSPTILQCQILYMKNAQFSFKDFKVLYAVKVIETEICRDFDPNYWQQFLEQPGAKPVVVLHFLPREVISNLLARLSKAFSSAILPNTFKIVIVQDKEHCYKELNEFRETNNTSSEILELKKGLPAEYQKEDFEKYVYQLLYECHTLERSSI